MKPASEIAREIAESWIVDCKDCAQDLASCMESPADDPPNRCAILRKKIAAAIEAERDRAARMEKVIEAAKGLMAIDLGGGCIVRGESLRALLDALAALDEGKE